VPDYTPNLDPAVTVDQLREYLPKAGDEDVPAFTKLVVRATRAAEQRIGVPAGFYEKAADDATTRVIYARPFRSDYFFLPPHLPSPTPLIVAPAGYAVAPLFTMQSGVAVATQPAYSGVGYWGLHIPYEVTARWGFAEVPADFQEAVLQLAVKWWRSKDSAFSGVLGQMNDGGVAYSSTGFPTAVKDLCEALRDDAIRKGWILP
jgi:hypothetical protein